MMKNDLFGSVYWDQLKYDHNLHSRSRLECNFNSHNFTKPDYSQFIYILYMFKNECVTLYRNE